jgi:hypothetical protein
MNEAGSVFDQIADLMDQATDDDIEKLDRKIESLCAVRDCLKDRLQKPSTNGHIKPAVAKKSHKKRDAKQHPLIKASPGSPEGLGDLGKHALMDARRKAVVRYLDKNAPRRSLEICKACDIPQGSITAAMNHEWFSKSEQGYHLTKEARQDVLGE